MKIVDARVIVTRPGRNYVTLKIETSDGVYGLGDATLNGRELAVAAYLREHLVPMLIGRDPRDIEDIWQSMYKWAYWRRGPVAMTAIASIDMALWDIKGKVLSTPVWNLLGGRARTGLLAYGHASARTIPEVIDHVEQARAEGFRAVRVQTLVPGIEEMYGVPRSVSGRDSVGLPYEEPAWSSEAYLRFAPTFFDEVRGAVGPELHLLHDAHHRLTPTQAGWLGRQLEPHRLFWLEDVVPAELQASFRSIRQHTTTPLAVGEVFNSIFDCEQLIREQLIDYIRTSVVHAGGITHWRKIAAFADVYGVKTGAHGASDLSPITMAAAVHAAIATPNAAIQEYDRHHPSVSEVFSWSWTFEDGYLQPGDAPGLGVDIDEAAAAAFPYERAYIPASRLVDGSVGSY